MEESDHREIFAAAVQHALASNVPILNLPTAQALLETGAGYSATVNAICHSCQLPSNLPCEDTFESGRYNHFKDPSKDWCTWSIFDGHAGPRTSHLLRDNLSGVVGKELSDSKHFERTYTPNDWYINQAIKKAFAYVDTHVFAVATGSTMGRDPLSLAISNLSAAVSGSCALMALYDPANLVLRVANTGDSRAVLGRWSSEKGQYVAQPMSVDQTGFNQNEVERLKREHPDEEPVDPKTGRVHGIAVSRAFGDSRWKWSQELSQLVHDKFWGPNPRPEGMIKTPPYLTAEPEIMETKVQTGEKPDFLIMASDGLWDNMSSQDAVTCVQQWLDKFHPTQFVNEKKTLSVPLLGRIRGDDDSHLSPPNVHDINSSALFGVAEDEDTYYDEDEKCLKWRVEPKHFVVEDDQCGIHLIKNALGGKRKNLFLGIMNIQPPYSRNVRDDITVHVIFFGADTKGLL